MIACLRPFKDNFQTTHAAIIRRVSEVHILPPQATGLARPVRCTFMVLEGLTR